MSLSHGRALGSTPTYGKPPKVGDLVANDYRAWRVTAVSVNDEQLTLRVRPDYDLKGDEYEITASSRQSWDILPEHYSICARCNELQPCREQTAEYVAGVEANTATRYETAGICPACLEVTTARQATITFDENTMTPLGPPVTFHLRSKCLRSAIAYDKSWAKQLNRTPKLEESLTCEGSLHRHRDGVTTCTSIDCPSVRAHHTYWSVCTVLSHGCPRFECTFGAHA